jgi:hypothetical protein
MQDKPESQDILGRILAYVDSPFRLVAVIIMAVFAFVGWFLWQNQAIILGAYQQNQRLPDLNEDRIDDAVAHIFRYTDAQVIAVFRVNPILGTRELYRAYTPQGRDRSKEGIDVGLFTANVSNNRDVVALMSGEIPCGPYLSAQSEIGLWYIEQGMQYGCRISVPPEPSRFVGQITVGWRAEPTDLERTRTMLMIAATMLSRPRN